ncbi:MAG TPA: hypothetical protein PKG81_05680, partial [Candidatus Omnitrophota bacterium]|nr:hypothetical protein [Candidatus Omnitrophota bacterium]
HIIFTMDKTPDIKDDAFATRILRQRVEGFSEEDKEGYFRKKLGVKDDAVVKGLIGLKNALGKTEWEQEGLTFGYRNFETALVYSRKIYGDDKHVFEELYRILRLRFQYEEDRRMLD